MDRIRKTAIAKTEPGLITQSISASNIPISTINKICEPVSHLLKVELKIPGLLFIDTPGHAAFTNLRKRGGSIADLAILVIDITQGVQPQTVESIEILKEYKTPFVVVANKIDLVSGWKSQGEEPFTKSFQLQRKDVQNAIDEKIYTIVGQLSKIGFDSERFDRITDFTKAVAIIPVSAKSGEGIPELLLLISGLSQRYFEGRLHTEFGVGKGNILEVKFEKGLGTTIDIILYDGVIKKGDTIVFGTKRDPVSTKIRGLIEPRAGRYEYLEEIEAAAGLKIFASGLDEALPGSSVYVAKNEEEEKILKEQIISELSSVLIATEKTGVVLKADTLGSLEAITKLLQAEGMVVRKADIGTITRHEIAEAAAVREKDRYLGAILVFNVDIPNGVIEETRTKKIGFIHSNVIYSLIDRFKEWQKEERAREREEAIAALVWPAKLRILPDFLFRESKPAIFGVEILVGTIKASYELMKEEGTRIGRIKSIQSEKITLSDATVGQKVAIAVDGPIFGRHISENDTLITVIPKGDIETWKEKYSSQLTGEELSVLEQIQKILRKGN